MLTRTSIFCTILLNWSTDVVDTIGIGGWLVVAGVEGFENFEAMLSERALYLGEGE